MTVYNEMKKGVVKPRLVLGNIDGGGMVVRGNMRMFRTGQRHLSSYDYTTLDVAKFKSGATGGNKHIEVDEIERFFDRAGKGRPGATITDPRMTTGAVVFITMDEDDRYPMSYYTRSYTNDSVNEVSSGYRTWGVQNVEQESIALVFKLTQLDSGREAYFDNSRFMVSNILWEFSPDGGRGKWYQLYELPNQKVRVTLPHQTQQIRVRAISNNPEEWVQSIALTPKVDFQNRYAIPLHWILDKESQVPEDYIEYDDLGYLVWPKAQGGYGDVIYTLYWTPEEDFADAIQIGRTKRNDLAPDEFELPVKYLGGWLHIFAQDIMSTLHIKKRFTKSIADCEVLCNPSSATYTGRQIEPAITVRFKLDLEVLPPEFYSIEYVDNVNVGEATVIVTGLDYYYGTPEEPGHFQITPANVNSCTISLNPTSFVYNGSANRPSVTLKLGTFTVKSSDYTLTYSDNVNAGTGKVKIVGKDNMTGECTKTFQIAKAPLSAIELDYDTGVYGEQWALPGYIVRGVNNVVLDGSSYTMAINPDEITGAGIYRYTATGKGNYQGSITKDFTITGASVSNVTFSAIEDQWFTGRAITPRPVVTRRETLRDGTVVERELVEGTDFYFSWEDNVIVGTAKVIVTGIGNYSGQAQTTFNIINKIGDGTWGTVKGYKWLEIKDYTWGQVCGAEYLP